ncbi:hypothetical protein LPB144_08375 [Christiangramia salexigens]|uniref:Capsule assembly Wzi family protein n=1 Tax=Christiangramia salexigens TaxID=1913577 RepID=A0A1L3J8I8_9FLAO|nr:hypothetical protein LPB144_08375 [Christiangramia salexigens]
MPYFLVFLLLGVNSLFAQIEYSGSANIQALYSNKKDLPFWLYSNQRGRISPETNITGWITGKMNYDFSYESSLEIGGGLLYENSFSDKIIIDELYANLKYSWLQVIAGRKQKEELYNGLSATNENFAWSLNHRPLPGIQIKSSRPIYFNQNENLGFEFSWNEYFMGNNRFVKGTRLHFKSLYLVYEPQENFELSAGITHFAQWGGDSPETGPQPEAFSDYLRVVAGREGGEKAVSGDQANVAGSHLGTYEIYATRKFRDFSLSFIYNHFFEDGTGSRYANFPDGRYGFYFNKEDDKSLIKSVIYEFYYTRNQSINSSAPHKNDAYFNNFLTYRSGWTYQERIIGVPFFDFDPDVGYIIGNKFLAHHIGVAGSFNNYFNSYPFKFIATYVRKDGAYTKRYIPNRDECYITYEQSLLQKPFDLKLRLGAEISNVAKPIYAAGLSLKKNF